MEAFRSLLKARGFKINASNTVTVVTKLSGSAEACDEGLANFINRCREDPCFEDYKLLPLGEGVFIVAVDYGYAENVGKLREYCDAIVHEKFTELLHFSRIKSGSFGLSVKDGHLCYRCERFESLAGRYMECEVPVPDIEEKVIQYALKVLPSVTHPKQA